MEPVIKFASTLSTGMVGFGLALTLGACDDVMMVVRTPAGVY